MFTVHQLYQSWAKSTERCFVPRFVSHDFISSELSHTNKNPPNTHTRAHKLMCRTTWTLYISYLSVHHHRTPEDATETLMCDEMMSSWKRGVFSLRLVYARFCTRYMGAVYSTVMLVFAVALREASITRMTHYICHRCARAQTLYATHSHSVPNCRRRHNTDRQSDANNFYSNWKFSSRKPTHQEYFGAAQEKNSNNQIDCVIDINFPRRLNARRNEPLEHIVF